MRLLAVTVPVEAVEWVSGRMWAAGVAGIEERPTGTEGLVELLTAGAIEELTAELGGQWPIRVVEVDADEWVESWKPWAAAVEVADGLVVRPPWVAATGAALEVVIDPDRAWGHGAHPTTVCCVGHLARRRPPAERVLDVGCGSGTVCVAAALFGAVRVVGIDIDPEAVVATRANAALNGVETAVAVSDELLGEIDGRFDVVVANVGFVTLHEMCGELVELVRPGGELLASGFFIEDVERVVAPFVELGLAVETVEGRDGWGFVALSAPLVVD